MSWFGGGKKEESSETTFPMDDSSPLSDGGGDGLDLGGGGGGGGAMAELQQAGMALQQQMIIQQVITELSDKAFMKCIHNTKDSKLSSREMSCIQACTNKWLDASEMIHGRQTKKEQQAMSQEPGGGFA